MSNNIFINLTEELANKGWTVHWEFNSGDIDPALLKYNDCVSYLDCRTINPNVATDVDKNGAWNYRLDNLKTGGYYNYYTDEYDGLFLDSLELKSFNVDLSKLTNGEVMFSDCANLTSFDSDLSSLLYGGNMFQGCISLTSFDSDLSKLTDGYYMFEGCFALESFDSDLSNLDTGECMFGDCSSLTSFNSDLSSLIYGYGMFQNCKLDTASVKNIASTINTASGQQIDIGIGNSTPNEEEETAFNTIANKGWTVFVNGTSSSDIWTPTASTNLTDEEQPTPIPFYSKPIQVTEEHANYTSSDGKFYNIVGAQFIYGDDISTYGQFTSFEHAEQEICLAFNLTKYVKPSKEETE